LEKISLKIAEALPLQGLMDVEVIVHNNQLKVLEIDARLPSQTPTVVYWSSGINMLELLGQCFSSVLSVSSMAKKNRNSQQSEGGVVYEHIRVTTEAIEVCGEHIMTDGGPLQLYTDFFGADEAITNYSPGQNPWVATLINSGLNLPEAWEKRHQIIKNIRDHFKLKIYKDLSPKKVAIANNNDYNSPSRHKTNKIYGFDLSNH
jgi:pyrrolysine biosynthesis protein PylC